MSQKVKIGAVSYLNTKPLLYGLLNSNIKDEIEIVLDYPSNLVKLLKNNELDLALLPVAAINEIPGAQIISDYGIAADGNVASVAIFSEGPIESIKSIFLDYQSRTSVALAKCLLKNYWQKEVEYMNADLNYIEHITKTAGGVIIGDRALKLINKFKYNYDLSYAWKKMTGLDFVFAAWIANKKLSDSFLAKFNEANLFGIENIDNVVRENYFPEYDLKEYYTNNIKYFFDESKLNGMKLFLDMIRS